MAKKLNISNLQPSIILDPVEKDDIRYVRCRVLIVCEGEKTEPNYFRSFSMMKNSSGLVYEVSCDGGGINTLQVVEKAVELRDKAEKQGLPYDSVWAVFDRDSFKSASFDNAIAKAEAHDIGCAWSNEAFELWYIYHFDARSTAMSRTEYKRVITQRVNSAGHKLGKTPYVYKKNDPKMRTILSLCLCNEEEAIRRAKAQASTFSNRRFHTHNPCTMVYKLVSLLIGKDTVFNHKIEDIISQK